MSLVQTDDDKRRLWNVLGGLVLGNDTGGEYDFHITSRGGQIAIGTQPVVPASPVIANVGGIGITLPMVLIGGIVAFLVLRK